MGGAWIVKSWPQYALPTPKMPDPYAVKFWPEVWESKPHYWHFYEREEVEQSTYDKVAVQKPKPAIVEVAQAVVPEAVPEAVPDLAPEVVPEVVPEVEAVAEAAPEVAAEEVAEVAAEVVPEPPAEVTPAPEGGDQ